MFLNLGITWSNLDNPEKALAAFQECAVRAPGWLPVQQRLGLLLLDLERPQEAGEWLKKAVGQAPDKDDLWHKLGQAAEKAGEIVSAADAYRRSIALTEQLGEAGVRLARLLWETGQREEALGLLRRLADERPRDADSHANLGFATLSSHRYVEALACYRVVVSLKPDYPDAEERVAKCLLNLGEMDAAYEIFARLVSDTARRRSAGQGYLMSLLYSPRHTPEEVLAQHQRVTEAWTKDVKPLELKRGRSAGVLRVGYLTADLEGTHPVAQFVGPILRAHRERDVDCFVYFNRCPGKVAHEEVSQVADLKTVDHMDDGELARIVASDELDILVDLSGHTHGTRLPVMAYRPAPVQVSFCGYPHSTGFEPVDYLIADAVVAPPEADHLCSERVARLPHAFLCFVPPREMPRPRPRLAGRQIVFGSLNHLPKVSGQTLVLWARVLQAVPDSRLLVKCAAFCGPEAGDIYRQYFAEQGISPDRLDFEGPSNFADAMRAYDRIDIALDTVPYNGGTTTCHALWMGVPVVSLKGGNFCGRMGASFLAAAGFPGLVAADQRGFVDIAANLATDSAGLDNLKAAILERLPNSPLCDIDGYAGDLLALYKRLAAR